MGPLSQDSPTRLDLAADEALLRMDRGLAMLQSISNAVHRIDGRLAEMQAEAHPFEIVGDPELDTSPPAPERILTPEPAPVVSSWRGWLPPTPLKKLDVGPFVVFYVVLPAIMAAGAWVLLLMGVITPQLFEAILSAVASWVGP